MYPILFRFGAFPVYSYGFLLALAFAVCTTRFIRAGKKAGLAEEKLLGLALWIMGAAMIGARLLYVWLALPVYTAAPLGIFNIRSGGLSFHGGLLCGSAAGLWYAGKHHLPQGLVADLAAPYLALGYALVRIGCFLNGCCYGRPSGVFWAIPAAYGDETLRHPVQLYAFFAALFIFFFLRYRSKKTRFTGQLFWEFIFLYGLYRFCIEFYRAGSAYAGFPTLGQAASLAGIIISLAAVWRGLLRRKKAG